MFLNYNFLPVEDFICKVSDEYDAWLIGYIVNYKYPDNSINSGQGETVVACQWFKNTGECIINGENEETVKEAVESAVADAEKLEEISEDTEKLEEDVLNSIDLEYSIHN